MSRLMCALISVTSLSLKIQNIIFNLNVPFSSIYFQIEELCGYAKIPYDSSSPVDIEDCSSS